MCKDIFQSDLCSHNANFHDWFSVVPGRPLTSTLCGIRLIYLSVRLVGFPPLYQRFDFILTFDYILNRHVRMKSKAKPSQVHNHKIFILLFIIGHLYGQKHAFCSTVHAIKKFR